MFLKIPINNTCHIITNLCNKYSEMLLTSHAETASADFFGFIIFFHALVMLVSSVL